MIVVAAHASLINGKIYEAPANTLVEVLTKEKKGFIYVRHSIDGGLPSMAYFYKNGKIANQKKLFVISKISVLRYITEIISSFYFYLFLKHEDGLIYIGVDPLNALTGILVRNLGKFKKAVFYTADYSEKRFENNSLNNIYQKIDSFCVRNAQQVWSVSSRICDLRRKMGLPDEKNIFLPNVPSDEYKKFVENKRNKYQMITLGILGDQLDFENLFEAMKNLKIKYPKLKLKIIGNGPKEDVLKKLVKEKKIDEMVEFSGFLPHDKALEEESKSGIGLALYNGNWSFNIFGDSMKCREYFCFGLPVITTDTHATVEEIRDTEAGIICGMNPKEYEEAIKKIINNYDNYYENSLKLGNKYDNIHLKSIRNLIESK